MGEEPSVTRFESYTPRTKLGRPSRYTLGVLYDQAATDRHFEDTNLLKDGESMPIEVTKVISVHRVPLLLRRDHKSHAFQGRVDIPVQQMTLVAQHCNINDKADEGG